MFFKIKCAYHWKKKLANFETGNVVCRWTSNVHVVELQLKHIATFRRKG